jgi:hypothetical protein
VIASVPWVERRSHTIAALRLIRAHGTDVRRAGARMVSIAGVVEFPDFGAVVLVNVVGRLVDAVGVGDGRGAGDGVWRGLMSSVD